MPPDSSSPRTLSWLLQHCAQHTIRCCVTSGHVLRAGIRVPDHAFVRDVCRRAGGAIALTSANLSGQTSPLEVEETRQVR